MADTYPGSASAPTTPRIAATPAAAAGSPAPPSSFATPAVASDLPDAGEIAPRETRNLEGDDASSSPGAISLLKVFDLEMKSLNNKIGMLNDLMKRDGIMALPAVLASTTKKRDECIVQVKELHGAMDTVKRLEAIDRRSTIFRLQDDDDDVAAGPGPDRTGRPSNVLFGTGDMSHISEMREEMGGMETTKPEPESGRIDSSAVDSAAAAVSDVKTEHAADEKINPHLGRLILTSLPLVKASLAELPSVSSVPSWFNFCEILVDILDKHGIRYVVEMCASDSIARVADGSTPDDAQRMLAKMMRVDLGMRSAAEAHQSLVYDALAKSDPTTAGACGDSIKSGSVNAGSLLFIEMDAEHQPNKSVRIPEIKTRISSLVCVPLTESSTAVARFKSSFEPLIRELNHLESARGVLFDYHDMMGSIINALDSGSATWQRFSINKRSDLLDMHNSGKLTWPYLEALLKKEAKTIRRTAAAVANVAHDYDRSAIQDETALVAGSPQDDKKTGPPQVLKTCSKHGECAHSTMECRFLKREKELKGGGKGLDGRANDAKTGAKNTGKPDKGGHGCFECGSTDHLRMDCVQWQKKKGIISANLVFDAYDECAPCTGSDIQSTTVNVENGISATSIDMDACTRPGTCTDACCNTWHVTCTLSRTVVPISPVTAKSNAGTLSPVAVDSVSGTFSLDSASSTPSLARAASTSSLDSTSSMPSLARAASTSSLDSTSSMPSLGRAPSTSSQGSTSSTSGLSSTSSVSSFNTDTDGLDHIFGDALYDDACVDVDAHVIHTHVPGMRVEVHVPEEREPDASEIWLKGFDFSADALRHESTLSQRVRIPPAMYVGINVEVHLGHAFDGCVLNSGVDCHCSSCTMMDAGGLSIKPPAALHLSMTAARDKTTKRVILFARDTRDGQALPTSLVHRGDYLSSLARTWDDPDTNEWPWRLTLSESYELLHGAVECDCYDIDAAINALAAHVWLLAASALRDGTLDPGGFTPTNRCKPWATQLIATTVINVLVPDSTCDWLQARLDIRRTVSRLSATNYSSDMLRMAARGIGISRLGRTHALNCGKGVWWEARGARGVYHTAPVDVTATVWSPCHIEKYMSYEIDVLGKVVSDIVLSGDGCPDLLSRYCNYLGPTGPRDFVQEQTRRRLAALELSDACTGAGLLHIVDHLRRHTHGDYIDTLDHIEMGGGLLLPCERSSSDCRSVGCYTCRTRREWLRHVIDTLPDSPRAYGGRFTWHFEERIRRLNLGTDIRGLYLGTDALSTLITASPSSPAAISRGPLSDTETACIWIKIPDSSTNLLRLPAPKKLDTVHDIMTSISTATRIPVHEQRLLLHGLQLDPRLPAHDFRGTTLQLSLRIRGGCTGSTAITLGPEARTTNIADVTIIDAAASSMPTFTLDPDADAFAPRAQRSRTFWSPTGPTATRNTCHIVCRVETLAYLRDIGFGTTADCGNLDHALAASPTSLVDSSRIILDTGASLLICKHREMFDYIDNSSSVISTAGEGGLPCLGRGPVTIGLLSADGDTVFVTVSACFCPSATHNLLGTSELLRMGWTVTLLPIHEQKDGRAGEMLSPDARCVPLRFDAPFMTAAYVTKPAPTMALMVASSHVHGLQKEMLWHLKGGHLNHEAILRACGRVRGVPALERSSFGPCWDCQRAKARRSGPGNMGVLNSHATVPLQLVFMDLAGPMRVPAVGPDGREVYRYSLILQDKYTKKRWDVPLQAKSDTPPAVRKWIIDVNALTPYKVQRFHSDNGTEFTNHALKAICSEFHISQTYSTSYEPRQNGVVERAIGDLTRRARSMLATSNVPIKLWWFARNQAVECSNIFGTGDVSERYTPDELFFQREGDASLQVPFGCRAFCWRDPRTGSDPKWNMQGEAGIVCGTGLSVGRRSFAVYTPDGRIVHAVNVTVDQNYFPYRPLASRRLTSEYWNADLDPHLSAAEHTFDDVYTAVLTPLKELPAVEGGESGHDQSASDTISGLLSSMHIDGASSSTGQPSMQLDGNLRGDEYMHRMWAAVKQQPADGTTTGDASLETASPMMSSSPSITTTDDSTIKDADLNCPDGTYAPDLIGMRVIKLYKRNNVTYHGTVVEIVMRPELKPQNRIQFKVLFDEDNDYDVFTYKQITEMRDDETTDTGNAAFTASDIIEELKGENALATGGAALMAAATASDSIKETGATPEQEDYTPDVVPTRREMLRQPDKDKFIEAEHKEMQKMVAKGVFKWVKRPAGARVIASKFTYKRKRGADGEVKIWKARCVARGFTQIAGIDYQETASPVATATAFRMLMVLALLYNLDVSGGDVETAFLNADLPADERHYMSPPAGYECSPEEEGKIILLQKSIYGLSQSSRLWFDLLSSVLEDLGYSKVDGSGCFWQYCNGPDCISIVTIYVDDYAHAYNQQWLKERLENTFNSLWGISGVGPITYHLGLQVDYKKGEYVRISQKAYFEKLMKRFSFDRHGASLKTDGALKGTVDTPLDPERIIFDDCPAVIDEDIKAEYLAVYGSILYGTVHTRPDTAKAMTILGRYMHSPSVTHLAALKRVMRYVSKTVDYGLEYNKKDWFLPNSTSPISPFSLINMTDSDWAGDKDKRLSTTGTVTFLCGAPISWRSATQKLQALSSAEAEYIAACEGAKDVLYSRGILKSVDFHPKIEATPMYIDNSAAIAIMSNSGINSRTKHIDLRHHFVRELVSRGDVTPIKVASADNVSDVLTKAVDKATFQRLTPYLIRKVHH